MSVDFCFLRRKSKVGNRGSAGGHEMAELEACMHLQAKGASQRLAEDPWEDPLSISPGLSSAGSSISDIQ